jgi:uncharacterized repeat protein (TIGR02543 family)
MNSIKRINKMFITGMLAMALVFGMASCDEVLNEPETEVTGYGITLLDKAVHCIVTFDPQGGDMGVAQKNLPYGDTAPKPSPDPTKAGYTFGGWYTDTACKSLYDFDTPVKADITIYAKWLPISCKVIYNLNGAPGTPPELPPDNSGYLTYGQKVPVVPTPKWPGYTFDGWYLNADGMGAAWNFGTDTVTGDITLYAKWTSVAFTVGSFAEAIEDLKNHTIDIINDYVYTLESTEEEEHYDDNPTLTMGVTSPAKVTIKGNSRFVTIPIGGESSITVGSGVTLTLMNITFTEIPFTVAAGGKLILGDEDNAAGNVVIANNTGTGITVNGTSAMSKGTLEIKAGALIMGNQDSGIVLEDNSVLTMTGGEIMNNYAASYGCGVRIDGGEFTMSGGTISGNNATEYGGGVAMMGTGTFTMNGGTISNNSAESGGGVALCGEDSHFTMNGGEISWNTGTGGSYFDDGGGVAVQGGGVVFTMNGGSIHDNAGLLFGGGIFVSEYANTCTLKLTGGEIYNNRGGYDGGGVWIYENLNVTFEMSGGKIRNNQATYNGAGVYILSGNTFNMTGGEITDNSAGWDGAGVYTGSNFNMTGGKITDNSAVGIGGGVNVSGSTNVFTMSNGEITGNSAGYDGGGVYIGSGNAAFTMSGGKIRNNQATYNGAGVYINSGNTFNMTDGEITDNSATEKGGGVYVLGSTNVFTMSNGEITGNSAGYDGGGVYIGSGNTAFTMSGGKIRNNQATYNGAGVYILSGNTFNMTGGEITGNSAGGVYSSNLIGNPQIGGTNPGTGRGWIHGNTPYDVYYFD